MTSDFQAAPFSLPGVVRRPTPYRGVGSGVLTQNAKTPVAPKGGGVLANWVINKGVNSVRQYSSSPPVFSSPTPPKKHFAGGVLANWNKTQSLSPKRPKLRAADFYRAGNLESARAILENIPRYGGEEAAQVVWARLVIGRDQAPPEDAECGPLFGGEART